MKRAAVFVVILAIMLVSLSGCEDNGAGPVKANLRIVDMDGKDWLDKEDFREVSIKESEPGFFYLELTLTDEGRQNMKAATQASIGKELRIYMNQTLVQSPVVNEVVDAESVWLGPYSKVEAMEMSKKLRDPTSNPTPAPTSTLTPASADDSELSERKAKGSPDDVRFSGIVSIEKNVQSAKLEFTLSKDLMRVTSIRILLEGIYFVINVPGGTRSLSVDSLEQTGVGPYPVVDGSFSWDMGKDGQLTGKIKPTGDFEGTLHYIYQYTGTDLYTYTYDLGECPWTAHKVD